MLISCDPGITGAFCLNDWATGRFEIVPMPVQKREIRGSAVYTASYCKVHASLTVLDWAADHIDRYSRPPTWWVNCARRSDLGISFVHLDDVQLAYRHYLTERWALDARTPTWLGRKLPDWLLTLDKENT